MNKSKYLEYAHEYGLYIGLVICGLGLTTVGIVKAIAQTKTELNPPIVSSEEIAPTAIEGNEMVVDVAGGVNHPGVYRLKEGARLGDAMAAAGGLSVEADVNLVSRQINLADFIRDGMKIYIPTLGEEVESKTVGEGLISINRATGDRLEELWGVGEARPKTIMEKRPYSSLEELVSKAGLPQSVIDNNLGKMGL